jgi:hypothetical protein
MPALMLRDAPDPARRRRMRRVLAIALAGVAVEVIGLRRRGWGAGGSVVVRCRKGHLFTTIWIPAASLKSVRLGWWRVQRCPVGSHWSIVTPVVKASLSAEELRAAREHRDIRVP